MSDTTPAAHHYGVTVTDLDAARAFYRDVLGLEVVREFAVEGEAFSEAVDVPDASAEFVHLDAGGARVELVSYDPEGADRRGGDLNEPGTTHLGLSTPDVDAFYEELPSDVETLSDGPHTTSSGSRILFVCDPDGNLVELLET